MKSFSSYLVVAALATVARAGTYFVDPACDVFYGGITRSFEEAWSMAKRASDTMAAGNDANEQLIFSNLFKDASQRDTIRGYFEKLGDMTRVTDAMQADLIYDCGNDSEWVQTPGRPLEYKLRKYRMRVTRKNNDPFGCQKDPGPIATTHRNYNPSAQGWTKPRTVISLCDRLERSFTNWATTSMFSDRVLSGTMVDPDDDRVPQSILLNPCTSRTILHEAFHSNHIDTNDNTYKKDVGGGQTPYGWENAISKSPADQFKNADNYAVFAFALELFSKGYQMEDNPEKFKKGELKKPAATARRVMRKIRSLPRACRDWVYRRAGQEC